MSTAIRAKPAVMDCGHPDDGRPVYACIYCWRSHCDACPDLHLCPECPGCGVQHGYPLHEWRDGRLATAATRPARPASKPEPTGVHMLDELIDAIGDLFDRDSRQERRADRYPAPRILKTRRCRRQEPHPPHEWRHWLRHRTCPGRPA